ALPSKLMPIASIAEDIVLAVNMPPHDPAPGHAAHSTLCNASLSISPLLYCPTPSNADTASKSFPSNFPGNMVPPYTKTAGRLRRAIPIIQPGIFLSQPRSEEHTSELQSRFDLVCRLLLEKKKKEDDPRSSVT